MSPPFKMEAQVEWDTLQMDWNCGTQVVEIQSFLFVAEKNTPEFQQTTAGVKNRGNESRES